MGSGSAPGGQSRARRRDMISVDGKAGVHRLGLGALRQATGRGVRVAVVDSGWPQGLVVKTGEPLSGLTVDPDTGATRETAIVPDTLGHGGRCTGQILSLAPQAEIVPIKVFHRSLETSPVAVEQALYWAAMNSIDIVSLSLATVRTDVIPRWYRACEFAAERGIVIVAAQSPTHQPSYPACFAPVIGVRSGSLDSPYSYKYDALSDCECDAWGFPSYLASLPPPFARASNSLAAATIAGIAALLRECYGAQDPRPLLEVHAV